MSKSKDKNESEHLRGIIRQLKKENKSLKKQLNRSTNEIELDDIIDEVNDILDYSVKCPNSKCDGSLEIITVANRIFDRCNSCGFRSPAKKI